MIKKSAPNLKLKAETGVLSRLLFCAPPLALLATDLLYHPINISSWLAMRIYAARLMTEGKELYLDFFDWTQPLLLGSFKLLLELREVFIRLWTGFKAIAPSSMQESLPFLLLPNVYITIIIFAALILSLVICAKLIATPARENQYEHRLWLPVALSLTALIVRFDFGDLQFLLLLGLLPWLLLK